MSRNFMAGKVNVKSQHADTMTLRAEPIVNAPSYGAQLIAGGKEHN